MIDFPKGSAPFSLRYVLSLPILLLMLVITQKVDSQTKYRDLVYSESQISVTSDLNYGSASDSINKEFRYDIYQAKDSSQRKRPLIIWIHGGGFKFGSKSEQDIRIWCMDFARRGYIAVAINYYLSKKNPLTNPDELVKSSYQGSQYVRLAVAYFRSQADRLHIDLNRVILAGNSAGGILALHVAYSTNAQLREMAKVQEDGKQTVPDLDHSVAGVISFWGGMFNLNWLSSGKIPIVSVYGSTDHIVPPTHRGNLVFGSLDVKKRADSLGIPNTIKVYEGYGHELQKHFNPLFWGEKTKKRWAESSEFAAHFMYKQLFE